METKKETLTEYLGKPETVRKVSKGAYMIGIVTTMCLMIWWGIRFWKTDYFFILIVHALILWRLIKVYRRTV